MKELGVRLLPVDDTPSDYLRCCTFDNGWGWIERGREYLMSLSGSEIEGFNLLSIEIVERPGQTGTEELIDYFERSFLGDDRCVPFETSSQSAVFKGDNGLLQFDPGDTVSLGDVKYDYTGRNGDVLHLDAHGEYEDGFLGHYKITKREFAWILSLSD